MDMTNLEVPSIAVEIIKLGFHGAAIALVWVAFSQMRHITSVWDPDKLKPDVLPVFRELTGTTRFLLIVSTFLFIIGVGAQVFTKPPRPTHVTVIVSPSHWNNDLKYLKNLIEVQHGNTTLDTQSGQACIITEDKDNIQINLEELVEDIRQRNYQMRYVSQANSLKSLETNLLSAKE